MIPPSSHEQPTPIYWGFDALGDTTPENPIPPAPLVCIRHGHVRGHNGCCVVCDVTLRLDDAA